MPTKAISNPGRVQILYFSISIVIAILLTALLHLTWHTITIIVLTAIIAPFLEATFNYLFKLVMGTAMFKYNYACILTCKPALPLFI